MRLSMIMEKEGLNYIIKIIIEEGNLKNMKIYVLKNLLRIKKVIIIILNLKIMKMEIFLMKVLNIILIMSLL